jgi:phosphatidylglycerophosphate synthase
MSPNPKNTVRDENIFQPFFDIIDSIVEIYLATVIKPFLVFHEKFYNKLNHQLRDLLDSNSDRIPTWFTANFITYFRTLLIIPCLMLLVNGYYISSAIIVLSVDFGDFLDGVVARYWVDKKKEQQNKMGMNKYTLSDESEFEPSTESSSLVTSWLTNQNNRAYGGFIDAVCDKVFVVPCWIYLLSTVPSSSIGLYWLQYIVLWCLILTEVSSGTIRFRAYFTLGTVATPKVQGLNFSSSAVKADHIGKAKQTFEMLGTTFYVLPSIFRSVGLLLLTAAVPLAYESVRRKIVKRVIYVDGTVEHLDSNVLKFWTQAKGMGSKLIVGISNGDNYKDMVLNACCVEKVDAVVTAAPEKITLSFMKKYGIDFVVCKAGQTPVSNEVLSARMCLIISEDDAIATVLESKGGKEM